LRKAAEQGRANAKQNIHFFVLEDNHRAYAVKPAASSPRT